MPVWVFYSIFRSFKMKKRILLAAGLIGILLVSVLAFTGCGDP